MSDVPKTVWALALLAVCIGIVVAMGPLEGIPHVTDEVVYTLQARVFAAGSRTAPAADVPSMVSYPFWIAGQQSYGAFPFGWPLLLAVGEWFGVGFVVNPLLAGISVLLTFLVSRRFCTPTVAETAAAVVAVSPALGMLAASRMSHTSVLVAVLLWTWATTGPLSARRAIVGGAALAYAVIARPWDALVLGAPFMVWVAFRAPASLGARFSFLVVPVAAAGVVLWDNHTLNGDSFRFPADAFYAMWSPERPSCNRLGFGPDVGCVPVDGTWGHTPQRALSQAWDRLVVLDRTLVGFEGGLVVALLGGLWARQWRVGVALVLVVVAYLAYWSPGLAYGARFYSPAVPALSVGLALALGRLGRIQVPVVVVVGLLGILRVWPELSDRYWCVDGELARLLDEEGGPPGVVFVDGRGERSTGWPTLGVPQFVCDPMLESGDAFGLWNPVTEDGWTPRHALRAPDQRDAFRRRFQVGRPAVWVDHDVAEDAYTLRRLPQLDPP